MSIVDQIREQVNRTDGISDQFMSSLADAYDREIQLVNERLTRCNLLLRKGLRSEALQLANMSPNLLEWSAGLDFPELEDWLEILQFYQIRQPSRLNVDVLQQLQQALVEEQPLEELLRRHRQLAIAKAPLAWRLRVLRSIAQLDVHSSVWAQDIEDWERARLREIPVELKRAIEANNFDECSKISVELADSSWTVSPPATLLQQANEAVSRMDFAAKVADLSVCAAEMNKAFSEQDAELGFAHRATWNSISQSLSEPLPIDLYEAAEPALLWLDDLEADRISKNEHAQHVADLSARLDEGKSVLEIQRAYQLATKGGEHVEPALVNRYQSVLRELQLTHKRKLIVKVIGIASAALLAGVAFIAWQYQSQRQKEIDNAITSVQQLLASDKLEEADDYLESLQQSKPWILADSAVAALQSDVSGRITAEADRQRVVAQLIEDADSEDPLKIDLALLNEAESKARLESEKEKLFRLRRRKQEADIVEQQKQFAAVREVLTEVAGKLDAIEELPAEQVSLPELQDLTSRLSNLRLEYPQAGAKAQELVSTLKARTQSISESVRNTLDRRRRLREAEDRFRTAQSLDGLKRELERFAADFPGEALSGEFEEVLKESKHWVSVDVWNRFIDAVDDYSKSRHPIFAKDVATKLNSVVSTLEFSFAMDRCKDLKTVLDFTVGRVTVLDDLRSNLEKDWKSTLVTLVGSASSGSPPRRLFAYESEVERVSESLRSQGGGTGVEVLASTDGTVRREGMQNPVRIIEEPSNLYRSLSLELKTHEEDILSKWEEQLLSLISKVMRAPNVDAAFKEGLILQIVSFSRKGSRYLDSELNELYQNLMSRRTLERKWYVASEPSFDLDEALTTYLRKNLSVVFKGISQAYAPIDALAKSRLKWVGSLQRDKDGNVQPLLAGSSGVRGPLFIVRPKSSNDSMCEIVPVGEVIEGRVIYNSDALNNLAGRPVFALSSQ